MGRWRCLCLLLLLPFFLPPSSTLLFLSYAGNQFYCIRKKTKTKQDTFPFEAHATQNIPLHSPLPLSLLLCTPSHSVCLSAKNSCKLFINAMARNFLLSQRSLSLDLALSPTLSLLSWLQFKHLNTHSSQLPVCRSNSTTYPNGLAPN